MSEIPGDLNDLCQADPEIRYMITATCGNGHTQELGFGLAFSREWVEDQAGLLDGSSSLYQIQPGPESVIGKCGICRAQIKCAVRESERQTA